MEHFPRDAKQMLTVNEFGQMDYTWPNKFHHSEKGQNICRLILLIKRDRAGQRDVYGPISA